MKKKDKTHAIKLSLKFIDLVFLNDLFQQENKTKQLKFPFVNEMK